MKKILKIKCLKNPFEFNEDSLREIPIFDSLNVLDLIDKDTILGDVIILRIYIREGLIKQLIIQPIMLEGIILGSITQKISIVERYIKQQIIYQFLLTKILNEIIRSGMNISRFSVIFD